MLSHDHIHRLAHQLGFVASGVTSLHCVPDDEMARFDTWLAGGCAANMAYMHNHREIRRDPALLLHGAKSIISLAMSYTPSVEVAGFAHYACGQDYHDVLRDRANQLVAILQVQGPCHADKEEQQAIDGPTRFRVCVDTAPILERYWAWQCGLGWIGRNRQLIVPNVGGEVFLCEILSTDELDCCDLPLIPRCGSCRRCIDACPNAALTHEALDARRCNSYLTIEHRGPFGEHKPSPACIYGCDKCLVVCPWQRFARPTTEPAFQPSDELLNMTSADWQNLTQEKFTALFRRSAVKRAKYEGLRRNIAAATVFRE